MDFIVLGGILGAMMMVAGTILRDLLPPRLRIRDDDTPWVTVRDRRRAARASLVGGRLATLAGIAILTATVLLVVIEPSDRIALTVVIGLSVLTLAACVGWVAWYRYQESTGAIQRRQLMAIAGRLAPVDAQEPAGRASRPRDTGRSGLDQRRSDRDRPVMAGSNRSARQDSGSRRNDRGEVPDRESLGSDRSQWAGGAAARRQTRPRLDVPGRPTHRPATPVASLPIDRPPDDPDREPARPSPVPPVRRSSP